MYPPGAPTPFAGAEFRTWPLPETMNVVPFPPAAAATEARPRAAMIAARAMKLRCRVPSLAVDVPNRRRVLACVERPSLVKPAPVFPARLMRIPTLSLLRHARPLEPCVAGDGRSSRRSRLSAIGSTTRCEREDQPIG